MYSVNRVTLLGNVGSDPEIRVTQTGKKLATFRLATTEKWKSDGEQREKTDWHSIAIFNPNIVDLVERYIQKGSKVYLEGKSQTRKWQNQSGEDRYTTEVVLDFGAAFLMLDPKGTTKNPTLTASEVQGSGVAMEDDLNDTIPF